MSAMQKQSTVGKDVRFERIRRITGYLVGTMDKWNDAKKAEEHDGVLSGMSASLPRLPKPRNLGVCRAHTDAS